MRTSVALLFVISLHAANAKAQDHPVDCRNKETRPAPVQDRPQWEYVVEHCGYHSGLVAELNKMGEQGWELIQIADGFGVFKRKKTVTSDTSRSDVELEPPDAAESAVKIRRGEQRPIKKPGSVMSVEPQTERDRKTRPGEADDGTVPRLIYLRHAQAGQVAKVCREVYQGKKIDISVESSTRVNAIVVVAPDAVFWKVKELVEALDSATMEADQTIIKIPTAHERFLENPEDSIERGMKASELEHHQRATRGIELRETPR
jgi:hypothetical protein